MSTKEEPKKYPIGGYAHGNYNCICVHCDTQFIGDKRAVQCESCAVDMIGEKEPKKEESQEDYEAWDELGNEINKMMEPLDNAFGVHPLLTVIRQSGKFNITLNEKQ